jgi:hypothetical protein
MALLFVDGFDSFGTTDGAVASGVTNKWQFLSTVHDDDRLVTGRYGEGMALRPRYTGNGSNYTATPFFTATATIVAGVAFRIPFESDGDWIQGSDWKEVMSFGSGTGTAECGIAVGSAGQIRVWRGSPSTSIQDSTSSGLVKPNRWHYLEFKATIDNAGSFDVYLDGVQVAFASNSGDTQNSQPNGTHVRLKGRTNQSVVDILDIHYDDFYCLDTTGSPNDFLGPQHVRTIFPNAVGDVADFTSSGGDNYAAVDDNGHDTDSTYVESSTTGHQDLYSFENITGGTINAAVVYAIAKRTDVSSFDIVLSVESNSVGADSAAVLVNSASYIVAGGVFLVDPNTTAAWTDSGINAAQFGYKVG